MHAYSYHLPGKKVAILFGNVHEKCTAIACVHIVELCKVRNFVMI